MRTFFPRFVGNEAIRRRLGQDIEEAALAHACILSAPRGGGKHMLARQIAMATACEHRTEAGYPLPCGTCAACRKIDEGHSPDVSFISREPDKVTMGVDVIRTLRADVATFPNELDTKVYIIEDTEQMTVQAQNALLLTLEEPPSFVLFLLLCEDVDKLLPTIRSRAPVYRLQPLDDTTMQQHLLSDALPAAKRRASRELLETSPEEFATVLRHSSGWVGKALSLLEPSKRATVVECSRDAISLCRMAAERTATRDMVPLLLLPTKQTRTEADRKLTYLQQALADLVLLIKSDDPDVCFFPNKEEAVALASRFTAERLYRMISAVEEARSALAANANVNLTMTHFFNRFTNNAL